MAKQLVETLTSKFEPDRYKDEYRRKVLEFIRRKGRGEKVTQLTPKPGPAKVIDLVEALKASLARQSKSETRVSNHAKSQRHSLKRHGT